MCSFSFFLFGLTVKHSMARGDDLQCTDNFVCVSVCWYKTKYLYKKYIFGLLELFLLMKSAEFIHELVTEMTLE